MAGWVEATERLFVLPRRERGWSLVPMVVEEAPAMEVASSDVTVITVIVRSNTMLHVILLWIYVENFDTDAGWSLAKED